MGVKLNQIIAVEKGVKSRHNSAIIKLHKESSHPALFNGFAKKYEPLNEEGENFPDETCVVQSNVGEVLDDIGKSLTELFDVVATKDFGNTEAIADVKLEDGTKILDGVPATFLLFLEKQLNDIGTFVWALPTLDPAEEWTQDKDSGLSRTNVKKTHKTKKVEKPVVLYDATEHHPAQTQMVVSDEIVGYWNTTKMSGAIQATRKKVIIERVSDLMKAVKFAREEANNTDIERKKVGEQVMKYLFA